MRFLNISYRINASWSTPYFLRVLEYHVDAVPFSLVLLLYVAVHFLASWGLLPSSRRDKCHIYHQDHSTENVNTSAICEVIFQFRMIIFDEGKCSLCQKHRELISRIGDLIIDRTFSHKGNEIKPASCWLVPLTSSVFIDWMKHLESSRGIIF